jgi:hypothetical protein
MTLHSKPVGVVFATTVLPASPVSGRPSAGLFVRGTRSAQPGDLCVRAGDRLVRVNGTSLVGMAAEDLDEVRARFLFLSSQHTSHPCISAAHGAWA